MRRDIISRLIYETLTQRLQRRRQVKNLRDVCSVPDAGTRLHGENALLGNGKRGIGKGSDDPLKRTDGVTNSWSFFEL